MSFHLSLKSMPQTLIDVVASSYPGRESAKRDCLFFKLLSKIKIKVEQIYKIFIPQIVTNL